MPDFVKLPSERVEQLRLLSRRLDKPIVEIISDAIRSHIDAGHLPDELPGISIRRDGHSVQVTFDDAEPIELSPEAARGMASRLGAMLAGKRVAGVIDLDSDWTVAGAGGGIRIGFPSVNTSKVISRDVARDVERLLNIAASK